MPAGSPADYSGIQKRMRKGTKSCLPCRKRKIRCSGAATEGESCSECISRGDTCRAQGLVRDDEALNKLLQERVALLEAQLKDLTGNAGGRNGHSHEKDHGSESTAQRPDEPIETCSAPLMHLLNNPVLGVAPNHSNGTPDDTAPGRSTASPAQPPIGTSRKHNEAMHDLSASLPTQTEADSICDNHSSWWPLYRDALGCLWGDDDCDTLRSFVSLAIAKKNPPILGLLLVCFAISTGDLSRFLPAVERRVANDEEYAATDDGLSCLMAMGMCYMGALQPRRAWMMHRRANGFLQLNGIHLRRKTPRHEALFWQLFHADRWVSLMIGLPYMMPDQLCDITIAPIDEIGEATWLYRQLGVITGRVIDCLQAAKGTTLSATVQVEEEMEKIKSQLSPGLLDMNIIRKCENQMEKYTRLYRVVHFYQLRAFVHLPFLLRSATQDRYEFSRKSCIDDSRRLLEAYIEIYNSNPSMITNGSVLSFNVFIAAGILLLGLIGFGRSRTSEYVLTHSQFHEDCQMYHQIMQILKEGAKDRVAGNLCKTCYTALEALFSSARGAPGDAAKRVVLPYFGTLSITHHDMSSEESRPAPPNENGHLAQQSIPLPTTTASNYQTETPQMASMDSTLLDPNFGWDMSFSYDGPFLPDTNVASWMFGLPDVGYDWYGESNLPTDWSWLNADLPPSTM